ncbi:MAG: hypothetical protein AB3N11_04470 [Arenibacterium sp.]
MTDLLRADTTARSNVADHPGTLIALLTRGKVFFSLEFLSEPV